jgi:nitric oxide reductase subunit C
MAALVAAFCGQSALVYLDETAAPAMRLSARGVQGRALWHRHNCQVCHQIYGFGGFLGPDLTNAAQRLTRARLDEVLTQGNAQMPAFHFDAEQIDAIETFLQELDRTGVGVARRSPSLDARALLAALDAHALERQPPQPAARGLATFRTLCIGCHVPLQPTALGFNTAPDLSTVTERLDGAAIRAAIVEGRAAKGMPPWPALGETAVGELIAFLRWLQQEREALRARAGGGLAQGLPWWEYR